jgi:hypothetical protein
MLAILLNPSALRREMNRCEVSPNEFCKSTFSCFRFDPGLSDCQFHRDGHLIRHGGAGPTKTASAPVAVEF